MSNWYEPGEIGNTFATHSEPATKAAQSSEIRRSLAPVEVDGEMAFGIPKYVRNAGWWARLVCELLGHVKEIHHSTIVKRGTKVGDRYACPRCYVSRFTKD